MPRAEPSPGARPRAVLLDADGTLFPSEEPAFAASAVVTNAFLAAYGVPVHVAPEELRVATTGLTFRITAVALCVAHGVRVHSDVPVGPALPAEYPHHGTVAPAGGTTLTAADLERWVSEERRRVSTHLSQVLRPDPEVVDTVRALGSLVAVAVVTNSARSRLDACLEATGLSRLVPPAHRFSAEDSLAVSVGKPDPAIYEFAVERLGVPSVAAIAVEDSVPGARSAIAAGIPTIGHVAFVDHAERAERTARLCAEGVREVTGSWRELRAALSIA